MTSEFTAELSLSGWSNDKGDFLTGILRDITERTRQSERLRQEEHARKLTEHLTETASTEAELRDAKAPWPYTIAQLTEYVKSLVERQHDVNVVTNKLVDLYHRLTGAVVA